MDTGKIEIFWINLNEFEIVKSSLEVIVKNYFKTSLAHNFFNFIGPFFKLPMSFETYSAHLKYY